MGAFFTRSTIAILFPYAWLFSFYVFGNTPQHFFSYFCWLLPFGVAAIFRLPGPEGRSRVIALFAVLTLAIAAWAYVGHVRRYTAASYPVALVRATWGQVLWPNNVVRPFEAISADLRAVLKPDNRFIVLSDGALILHYFPDSRYLTSPAIVYDRDAATERPCLRLARQHERATVRAAVSWIGQDFCSGEVEAVLRYPGSDLKVTVFRRLQR